MTRPLEASLALALILAVLAMPAEQKNPVGRKRRSYSAHRAAKKDFRLGAPFQLDELVSAVQDIYEERVLEAIANRGIAFQVTEVELGRLTAAGASNRILEAIRPKPPKGRPPAPPPMAGPLSLYCAPAECEVLVNGRAVGATKSGTKQITGMPPGEVVIDFRKNDPPYESRQISMTLEAGVAASSSVDLVPTRATQESFGKKLFSRIIEALGGEGGLAEVASLTANGEAALWDRDGKRSDWSVKASLKLAHTTALEINGAGLRCSVSLSDQSVKTKCRKLQCLALDLERNARVFRDHQLAALMNSLHKTDVRLLALSPDASTLYAVRETDKYAVRLRKDLVPENIRHESASGHSVEVLYSDYQLVGQTRYPKTTVLKFDGAPKEGMEFRFRNLERGK